MAPQRPYLSTLDDTFGSDETEPNGVSVGGTTVLVGEELPSPRAHGGSDTDGRTQGPDVSSVPDYRPDALALLDTLLTPVRHYTSHHP